MKKLVFAIMMASVSPAAFAQTANTVSSQPAYEKIMAEKTAKLNASHDAAEITGLGNDFVRIAAKESAQWLPNYYAALATVQRGRMLMREGKTDQLDAVADEAQKYLDASFKLAPQNAENFILQKMVHSLRMMVNPQARFMSEGMLAADALSKAEKLDPQNPRITLLRAEDTYFTPEMFGGSKTKGLELFKKSLEQFKTYKAKTALDPTWGQAEAELFLSQAGK